MDLTKKENKQLKPIDIGFKKVDDNKVPEHRHTGSDVGRISPRDLRTAFFKVVDTPPTEVPSNFLDQIQIYAGLLYIWDNDNSTWLRFNYYTP